VRLTSSRWRRIIYDERAAKTRRRSCVMTRRMRSPTSMERELGWTSETLSHK